MRVAQDKIITKMASDSKVATDSQGKDAIQANNSASDKDDEDDVDLGATSLPHVSLKNSKHDFEMINLDADEEDDDDVEQSQHDNRRRKRYRKKKKKKEQLSDSSSEDDTSKSSSKNEDINPTDLTWPLYLWYYLVAVSTGALRVAEYLGEKLAYFFGITSPKYQYVIDEFYRQKQLEQEELQQEQKEKEYVERMEAERIASLEGGESCSAMLTLPKDVTINTPSPTQSLP